MVNNVLRQSGATASGKFRHDEPCCAISGI
jgi:hypothetical protein